MNNNKNNLYINIGNTNISFGYFFKENIFTIKKNISELISDKKIEDRLLNIFNEINNEIQINNIYVISVSKFLKDELICFFKKHNYQFKFLKNEDLELIDLSYLENKKELGIDILVQSIYVSNIYKKAIVLSLGTATVIYKINNKKFEGAIILPGITKSLITLVETTNIKSIDIMQTKKELGSNTQEAISIGLLNSINSFVEQINKDNKTPIIYTGGNSKYFENKKWILIPDLEIISLHELDKQNKLN